MTSATTTGLFTREAAAFLRISPRTLERWRVKGGGPIFVKVGSRVIYTPDELDAWVESRKRRSTADPGPTESKNDDERPGPG